MSGRLSNSFTTIMALSLTLGAITGCASIDAPGKSSSSTTTTTTTTTSTTSSTSSTSDSPIQKCDSQSPGPYKTVTVDGAEKRQGRYDVGKPGGTLVRSVINSDPATFNYWAAADTSSREMASLMYAGLLDIDPYTGEVVPALAESFTVDPDHVTYTTKLRKGQKWSDGTPITAEDVAYTWNTIIKGGYGNASLRDVTAVEGKSPVVTVVDELTNKFVTAKPFVPFIRVLGMPIAPKHIVEPIISKKDGRKLFDNLWSTNAKPSSFVTSGMFTLDSFVPSQRVSFKRTNNFYTVSSEGKQLPYLEKITYLFVPEVTTNLLKFKGKEIDITAVRGRDAGDLALVAKEGNFKLYDFGPNQGSTFIMFNMNQRKNPKTGKPYVDPIKSVWFNDVNFRLAVSHAVDRQSIVSNYLKGLGDPTFSAQVSTSPFFNNQLKPYGRDLNVAKELLKKSGFTWDKEGNLADKEGHKVEFDLLTAAGGTFAEFVATAFQKDMKELGIKVNTAPMNFNLLSNKLGTSLDWQAVFFSLSGGDPLEPNDSANVYRSDSRLHLFDQRLPDDKGVTVVSDARPWEKQIDSLLDKGAVTFDKAERKKIYDEVQQVFYDQAPFIYLVSPRTIVGARNTIHNYVPTPISQPSVGLHNLEEIWVQ
ncbi:MAG: ABC transporter substrate-binding protein [Candidatus Obscuribacterales bacterium]